MAPESSDHRDLRAGAVPRASATLSGDAVRRAPAGCASPARRGDGPGGGASARDRRRSPPDLLRQPDGVASTADAAQGAAAVPGAARGARDPAPRDPCRLSRQPRGRRADVPRPVDRAPDLRPADRHRVRRVVRERAHRVSSWGRHGSGRAGVGDGRRRRAGRVPPGAGVPRLVLEDSAGSGFGLGVTVDELEAIDRALIEHGVDPARIGYCLDTAHLWGAGYDLRSRPRRRAARGIRAADRARPAGDGPPQRQSLRSRVAARPPRAPGRGAHRRAGPAERPDAPRPGARRVPHRDTGHGRGLRRDQPPASARLAAGRPLAELPREAFELRRSRSRSGPAEDPDDLPLAEPA